MRPSHYLIFAKCPFHCFCPSQFFVHLLFFRLHKGQTVSKNKCLFLSKNAQRSLSLWGLAAKYHYCVIGKSWCEIKYSECLAFRAKKEKNLPWHCRYLLATDLKCLEVVLFSTWLLALTLSVRYVKNGVIHGHCWYSTATVLSDFTPILDIHF